jgi:flagellar protein FlaJ
MSIESLEINLQQVNKIVKEILLLNEEFMSAETLEEKNFFESAINSLLTQLKIINDSIPELLADIKIKEETKALPVKRTTILPVSSGLVILDKKDRKKFIKELNISEEMLKKLRKRKKLKKARREELYKKPNNFVVLASKIFAKYSFKLADSKFHKLNDSLRKANMPMLLSTYLSIMFFSTFLAFLFALILAIVLSLFDVRMVVGIPYPIFSFLGLEGLSLRLLKNIAVSLFFPALTFMLFYLYPITQAASIKKRIESELPFVVIHMASIAGSGVEPSRIFETIALSSEYPVISKEFKKIMNQVNLYGYDLVNSLRNVSKSTSSEKLAELLNSISTNISGGGSLRDYLDKKAEETLLEYKLERKKYINVAETSMDIYIGILIAAPLILMVLLILMNVTGMGFGITIETMTYFIVGAIALMNIFFLLFLQIRQPK